MECGEDGEEGGEGVGLVLVRGGGRSLVEEGDAEADVWEGGGSERLEEDVDHDVRVVEVRVELVPERGMWRLVTMKSGVGRGVQRGYRNGREEGLKYAQLENGEVCEAIVLLTPDLMVQIVLENADV